MPPASDNPLVVAATIIGYIIALPLAALLIRGIFFIGQKSKVFDDLVRTVKDVKAWQDTRDAEATAIAWSFSVIEEDVNELQERAGIAPRRYPDRRVGPPDRRAAP